MFSNSKMCCKYVAETADEFRKNLRLLKEPNVFDLTELEKSLKECNFSIFYNQDVKTISSYENKIGSEQLHHYNTSITKKNGFSHKYLHFASQRPDTDIEIYNYICFLKIVFYEFFLWIIDSCNIEILYGLSLHDASRLFQLTILLPEEDFLKSVIRNTEKENDYAINIFKIANEFNISYYDVIVRGNQLELFKR